MSYVSRVCQRGVYAHYGLGLANDLHGYDQRHGKRHFRQRPCQRRKLVIHDQSGPGQCGPGRPILVISSAQNAFTRYYGEILLTEDLNEFTVQDISSVTSSVLASYDIAILGDMHLTSGQVSMLTTWVNGGGRLIAMHPDKQLAGLLASPALQAR